MRRTILFSLFLFSVLSLFSTSNVEANFFKAYYAKTANYPLMEMRYIARNNIGEPVTGLTVNNFVVKQNGVEIPTSALTLNCNDTYDIFPVNLVLLTDFTGSMNETVNDGARRREWLLEATRKFLDSIKLDEQSEIDLVPFSTAILPSSGFKKTKEEIFQWMELSLPPFQGLTNFNYPFLNPGDNVIELLKSKPNNIPRIIIMITDGYHEQKTDFQREEIQKRLLENNIILFTIAVDSPNDPTLFDLLDITTNTGGRAVQLSSKTELIKFYNLIAWDIQGKRTCRLEWNSDGICSTVSPMIDVSVELKQDNEPNQESNFELLMPEAGIKSLTSLADTILLGKNIMTFNNTLTAINETFNISSVDITPATGEIATGSLDVFPITVADKQMHNFTVTYNPHPESVPTLYKIKINSTPCETKEIFVVAPCGGVAQEKLTLDETIEGNTFEKAFDNIFENNTPLAISGSLNIPTVDAEFSIIEGSGAFTLLPGEKLAAKIKFAPQAVGMKTAMLELNIENAAICGASNIALEGNAIVNSVEDELAKQGITINQIMPNPSATISSLSIHSTKASKVKISLQNENSQNVLDIYSGELALGENNFSINSSSLPQGVYFAVINLDGKTVSRKMIVTR